MPKVLPTFEEGARAEGWRGLRLAALCVGVGAYAKHAKLDNTVRDAEAVYRAVNACPGCRAAIIRDPPDKKTIRKHLRAFLEELAPTGGNSAPPETVLLFVAGHGVQLGHHVYLIPTAASSDDETDLSEDCLSHLTLFEWLHRFLDAPAKDAQPKRFDVKFAVILDVCREPAAVPDAHSGQVLVSIDPERGAAPERWALCYSTSRGSVALDGDAGSHSPLAFGMLDARSGICAPGVALKQGIENACAAVRESTRQRPITVTLDVLGDFVLQPGPDREVPPGLPGTLSCSLLPSGRCLRVFLGYRVDSDQDLVERLYYQLKSEGIDVWWDVRCLPPGQPWEEGFADGLCSSDVYVPVISKAALAPCASLTPESKCDNVLLEHQLALELKMRGELHCIFPVLVGVLERHGQLGEIYGDFCKGDGMPSCPEVIVGSVEAKLSEHLFRKGKGVPQLPDAKRKVAGTLTAITEHQGVMLSGIKRDAVQKVVVEIVRACGAHRASPFVQHESAHKRARESDTPEAGDASKMARADIDSRLSKAAGKRLVDTSGNSSPDAKKAKQNSASASVQGSSLVGGAGASVRQKGDADRLPAVSTASDSDCNELVRFLTDKGLKAIALRFSEAMGMELKQHFEALRKEDLDDPDLSFLKRWQKDELLRLTTDITARACTRGINDSELSGDDTSSDSERDDRTEYIFDAVLAKHPGSPAQFEAHISGFLKSMLVSAPETATETFHVPFEGHSHELSYCMLVWMRFAKEACPEGLLRDKWLECIKTATQDRLLAMLETCLQQGSTCHKCWIRADFKKLNCTKPYAAAIFVTDEMVRHSLRGHAESVQKWQQDVVENWFQNGEAASAFLFRANFFLRQHMLNGISVVNQVVEIQSYVAFMSMTRLASLLLFEYLEARKLHEASAPGAAGSSSSRFQGFCMFVSSSNDVFSLTEADLPARRLLPTVLRGLRCLSRLSPTAWGMMGEVKTANDICRAKATFLGPKMDHQEGQPPAIAYSQMFDAGPSGRLKSIAQEHDHYIIGAINELQDNAIEAKAKNQWISLDENSRVLSFLDDGHGLNRTTFSRLLVFVPENFDDCRDCGKWAKTLMLPVAFWRGDGSAITEADQDMRFPTSDVEGKHDDNVCLSSDGIEHILRALFRHCPTIKSLQGLEAEFEKIKTPTGTNVLVFNLANCPTDGQFLVVDSDQDKNKDIRVESPDGVPYTRKTMYFRPFKPHSDIPSDYSLRAQTELFLMRPSQTDKPMIKFHIQGDEVKARSVREMCTFGQMEDCSFRMGCDPISRKAIVDDSGRNQVKCMFGFSPDAFERELSGLFVYFDKGNGQPLRLVQSYQLEQSTKPGVTKGLLGLVIVKPADPGFLAMDNGKQRFDGKGDNSWGLKILEKNCFERMKNYKEKVGDGSFTFQRDEYLKLKAELEDKDFYFGAAVWIHWDPGNKRAWWPGRILNRYDHEQVRGVPKEVWDEKDAKDECALLCDLFEDTRRYTWVKRADMEKRLILFDGSPEAKKREEWAREVNNTDHKKGALERGIAEAEELVEYSYDDYVVKAVFCSSCWKYRDARCLKGDLEGDNEWWCWNGFIVGEGDNEETLFGCEAGCDAVSKEMTDPTHGLEVSDRKERINRFLERHERKRIEFGQLEIEQSPLKSAGTTASVFKGKWVITGESVCVKVYKDMKDEDFYREVFTLFEITTNDHIVHARGFTFEDKNKAPALVMELMLRDMCDAINGGDLDTTDWLQVLIDVSKGMTYLHQKGISHCDLKPQNILLDDQKRAKICDFGLSRMSSKASNFKDSMITDGDGGGGGTLLYMAPEAQRFLVEGAGTKIEDWKLCDVYSFGASCYHLLTKRSPPFKESLCTRLKEATIDLDRSGIREIAQKCLESEPDDRYISFSVILKGLHNELEIVSRIKVQIASDDDLVSLKGRCKDENDHFLYRVLDDGDMRMLQQEVRESVEPVLTKGIISKCPYAKITALEHIKKGNLHSDFISTTRRKEWALYYALKKLHLENVVYPIVKIDVFKIPKDTEVCDFSAGSQKDDTLGATNKDKLSIRYAIDADEVLIKRSIPAVAIVDIFQIDDDPKSNTVKFTQKLQRHVKHTSRMAAKFESYANWMVLFQRQFRVPEDVRRLWAEFEINDDFENKTDEQQVFMKVKKVLEAPGRKSKQTKWWGAGKGKESAGQKGRVKMRGVNLAISSATFKDQRYIQAWKRGVMTIAVDDADRNDFFVDADAEIISFPLPDNSHLPEDLFLDIILSLTDPALLSLKAGKHVYIHCKAGVNRSVALAVVTLMRFQNVDFEVAKKSVNDRLKAKRENGAKINKELQSQIRRFEAQIKGKPVDKEQTLVKVYKKLEDLHSKVGGQLNSQPSKKRKEREDEGGVSRKAGPKSASSSTPKSKGTDAQGGGSSSKKPRAQDAIERARRLKLRDVLEESREKLVNTNADQASLIQALESLDAIEIGGPHGLTLDLLKEIPVVSCLTPLKQHSAPEVSSRAIAIRKKWREAKDNGTLTERSPRSS